MSKSSIKVVVFALASVHTRRTAAGMKYGRISNVYKIMDFGANENFLGLVSGNTQKWSLT